MVRDSIGDFVGRIKNASIRRRGSFIMPQSKFVESVVSVLVDEGYISSYEVDYSGSFKYITVFLKYYNGEPSFLNIKRISLPGCRIYSSVKNIPVYFNHLGTTILSTNKGILTDRKARYHKVGGELIFSIF